MGFNRKPSILPSLNSYRKKTKSASQIWGKKAAKTRRRKKNENRFELGASPEAGGKAPLVAAFLASEQVELQPRRKTTCLQVEGEPSWSLGFSPARSLGVLVGLSLGHWVSRSLGLSVGLSWFGGPRPVLIHKLNFFGRGSVWTTRSWPLLRFRHACTSLQVVTLRVDKVWTRSGQGLDKVTYECTKC